MRKFQFLLVLLVAGFLMISCGDDDDGGGTAGGSGTVQSAAVAPQGAPAAAGSNNFSVLLEQTTQTCADCGVWFDSAELVVHYTGSNKPLTHRQNGGLLIKQSSGKTGRIQTSLASIPPGSAIVKATLNMRLNSHEGIANSDNTSVITVYDFSGGSKGAVVRTITAAQDIKGKGYSKSNPNVPIDFTAYTKQVHGR